MSNHSSSFMMIFQSKSLPNLTNSRKYVIPFEQHGNSSLTNLPNSIKYAIPAQSTRAPPRPRSWQRAPQFDPR